MKYYEKIPENFLLLRFVVSRYCNYRCQYCYLTEEQRSKKKTMFSHHTPDEWLSALDKFKDKHLELYFTGGEPLLCDDFIFFLKEMINKDYVHSVRIDSNLSRLNKFLNEIKNDKIKFLASCHPTQIPFEKFMQNIELLKDNNMVGLVNIVASRENMHILKMSPHKLVKLFEEKAVFLNVAKDFERGLKYGYDNSYREYIDKLQHPMDNIYMNMTNLNEGILCGGGKHYVSLSRHGNIYSCGGKEHGNIFNIPNTPKTLEYCCQHNCPSILSYSFSASNEFSPVQHLQDYVERNENYRKGLNEKYMDCLWENIISNDLMPKEIKTISKTLSKIPFLRVIKQKL